MLCNHFKALIQHLPSGLTLCKVTKSGMLVIVYLSVHGCHRSSSVFRNIQSKAATGFTDDLSHGTTRPQRAIKLPPRLISFLIFRQQRLNPHLSTTPTQRAMSEHKAHGPVPAHSKSSSCLLCAHFAPGSLSLLHVSVVGTLPESAPALCQSTWPDYLLTELRQRG